MHFWESCICSNQLWMSKKQTAVSHSSKEDGCARNRHLSHTIHRKFFLMQVDSWMTFQLLIFGVIKVFYSSQNQPEKFTDKVQGNVLRKTPSNKHTQNQTQTPIEHDTRELFSIVCDAPFWEVRRREGLGEGGPVEDMKKNSKTKNKHCKNGKSSKKSDFFLTTKCYFIFFFRFNFFFFFVIFAMFLNFCQLLCPKKTFCTSKKVAPLLPHTHTTSSLNPLQKKKHTHAHTRKSTHLVLLSAHAASCGRLPVDVAVLSTLVHCAACAMCREVAVGAHDLDLATLCFASIVASGRHRKWARATRRGGRRLAPSAAQPQFFLRW